MNITKLSYRPQRNVQSGNMLTIVKIVDTPQLGGKGAFLVELSEESKL